MKFKTKPYEVEAVQFDLSDDCIEKIRDFIGTDGKVNIPDVPPLIIVLVFEEKIYEKIFRKHFVLNPYDWIVRDWAFPSGYAVLDDSQFRKRYEEENE